MPVQRVRVTLTDEQKDDINEALELLESHLTFCINLSPVERKRAGGLGDTVFSNTKHTYRILLEYPNIKPQFVDETIFKNNIDIAEYLSDVIIKLERVSEKILETAMAAATDANLDARAIYNNTKRAVVSLVPGSTSALEQLSKLYVYKKNKKSTNGTTEPTEPQTPVAAT